MIRALFLATLLLVPPGAAGQAPSVLHIRVALIDAEQRRTPVRRHALLISDNPATAAPRRIVTALDGTADVRLRPGSYTVESDQPVAFQGQAYQWTRDVTITSGADAVLELTSDNAEVVPLTSVTTTLAVPLGSDPTLLFPQWQESVVRIWTPTAHASGFVVDARGLIATNQRAVGGATTVEVQLTPDIKVSARVLAADVVRNVAVLWIDGIVAGALRPVPLVCAQGGRPAVVGGQEVFAIGAPLREPKSMTSGIVRQVLAHSIASDFVLAAGSAGGPVFTAEGGVIGITSVVDGNDERRREDFRIVPIEDACDVVSAAAARMQDGILPSAARLPVESARPFPLDALKEAAQQRAGGLTPYQISSSDFNIAFITPVLLYGAHTGSNQVRGRESSGASGSPEMMLARVRPLTDFSNWSEYVADIPPVLLIRVTPKAVESFWMTVARGAARTQGMSLPPVKRIRSGLSRMRALCGDAEVMPIHAFKLEQRVSESEAIYEGLYAFDPGSLGPHCGTVKLVLYSDREPAQGDARTVEPRALQQMWDELAPLRVQ